jgi:tRNA U34 5-carboxymethylaminomethyl modifying GTPase MnmE/TrmE
VIEESINLDGLPVVCGTRLVLEHADQVEQIGVNLSREHLEKSEAVVVVLVLPRRSQRKINFCRQRQKKGLIAINKIDLSKVDAISYDTSSGKSCDGVSDPGPRYTELREFCVRLSCPWIMNRLV